MTAKMWLCALAGMVIFAVLLLAIPIDVCLVAAGLPTISRWHMLTGLAHPLWFPPAVVALALLPVGAFMGHYWSPANLEFYDTARLWLLPLLLAPLVLFAGLVLGRLFVAQTL